MACPNFFSHKTICFIGQVAKQKAVPINMIFLIAGKCKNNISLIRDKNITGT